jgi:hypothetical protein
LSWPAPAHMTRRTHVRRLRACTRRATCARQRGRRSAGARRRCFESPVSRRLAQLFASVGALHLRGDVHRAHSVTYPPSVIFSTPPPRQAQRGPCQRRLPSTPAASLSSVLSFSFHRQPLRAIAGHPLDCLQFPAVGRDARQLERRDCDAQPPTACSESCTPRLPLGTARQSDLRMNLRKRVSSITLRKPKRENERENDSRPIAFHSASANHLGM